MHRKCMILWICSLIPIVSWAESRMDRLVADQSADEGLVALKTDASNSGTSSSSPSSRESFLVAALGRVEGDELGLYAGVEGFFKIESDALSMIGDLDFINDGKWNPTEGWMPKGYYFNLKESWFAVNLLDFSLEGGFLPSRHRYSENPYEILLDGKGKPAVGMEFAYEGTMLVYESRWIGLNYLSPFTYGYGNSVALGGSSDMKWKDRGFNHKLYMLKLGSLRLAYEESSVFLGRFFDANFFLNPAPSIFVNTLWSQGDNPWVYDTNDSSLMGFYADFSTSGWRAEAELILKDVNLPFGYPTNVNKFAWSAGFSWFSPIGRLSLWHGGATKYMFASSYQSATNPNLFPYEYTYYPLDVVDGRLIPLSENCIGYPYGENSLAFKMDWQDTIGILDEWKINAQAGVEWVLSGSKSPHNPWHEAGSVGELLPGITSFRTALFTDESVLENLLRLVLTVETEYEGFLFKLGCGLGGIFNALALYRSAAMVSGNEPAIWRPVEGAFTNASYFSLSVGYGLSIKHQQENGADRG